MASFSDEVAVFGASEQEVEGALAKVATEVWGAVDEAMAPLWKSEAERDAASSLFAGESLLLAPLASDAGVVRLRLDLEADVAAERISDHLGHPTLAMRRYRADWCALYLFERGRMRGEIFWARSGWSETFGDDDRPGRATPRGWTGEVGPFSILLSESARSSDLKKLLNAGLPDAEIFESEFKKLCGLAPA